MAHGQVPTIQQEKLFIGPVSGALGIPGLLIGVVALILAAWLGFAGEELTNHFFHSYLAAYAFFLAVTLGAMIFVLIQHSTRAGWSVTVRRLAEGLSLNMFLMVILLAPFFVTVNGQNGVQWLYHWFNLDVVAADDNLQAKSGYLNPKFFAIRMGLNFIIWCFMAWYFAAKSAEQDRTGDPRISVRLNKAAAPAIIIFAYSLTVFAIDWVMSLNPHWFSTMFGVYFFAGAMLSGLSAIVLLSLALQKRGLIGNVVNHEHYHDLGKFMFAFTFFWGYIAFSQYMLIWYANIPEETQFYIPRQFGQWGAISLVLLIVHLLIPFPGLLSRHVKRKNAVLAFWAVWSLCACALDVFWMVVPSQWIKEIPAEAGNAAMPLPNALPLVVEGINNIYQINSGQEHLARMVNFPLHAETLAITALCFIGIGGLYVFSTMMALRGQSLVPVNDPRLGESLAFENI